MRRRLNIKIQFIIFICCCIFWNTSFHVFAQSSKLSFNQNLSIINRDIIIDFHSAKNRIQELEKSIDKDHDLDKLIILQLKKIDLFSSFGDAPRVNYEINKTKKLFQFHQTSVSNKMWLHYFEAQQVGAKGDVRKMFIGLKKIPEHILRKNPHLHIYVNCAYARYFRERGNLKAVKNYLIKAEQIALQHKNMEALLFYINNVKAQILFFDKQWNESLKCFKENKNQAIKNRWLYAEQYMNVCLAEVHLEKPNSLDSAKFYFDLVLANKKNTELRDLYFMYSAMEYFYHLKNNQDSAYHYAREMNEIDDLLEESKSEDLVKELEKDYQFENTRFKLNAEIRKNNRLRNTLITFFLILISVIIIGYLFYRQKSKSTKLLEQQKDEIDHKNKQINLSLKEKENLLKEIHHRVKNNLQVITSLLNLQSKTIKDKDALRVIEESKDRIYAIALIHNLLYLNNDFAFVEMKNYVPKLLDQIKRSMDDHSKNISVIYSINDINLIIDEAVPTGLILCELISNSYKHAFKDATIGEISFQFNKSDQGIITIHYQDNGKGLPEGLEFLKLESTGAEIVGALIEQLDAEFEYTKNNGNGFGIKISFKSR